jgi:hypothetical protein
MSSFERKQRSLSGGQTPELILLGSLLHAQFAQFGANLFGIWRSYLLEALQRLLKIGYRPSAVALSYIKALNEPGCHSRESGKKKLADLD